MEISHKVTLECGKKCQLIKYKLQIHVNKQINLLKPQSSKIAPWYVEFILNIARLVSFLVPSPDFRGLFILQGHNQHTGTRKYVMCTYF